VTSGAVLAFMLLFAGSACAAAASKSGDRPVSGVVRDAAGRPVAGRWFLRDLHLRLACHAQRLNPQILNNEKLFFAWFGQVAKPGFDPYDEDAMFGGLPPDDSPRGMRRPQVRRARSFLQRVGRKLGVRREH